MKMVASPPRIIAQKIRTVPPISPIIVPISILSRYPFQSYEIFNINSLPKRGIEKDHSAANPRMPKRSDCPKI
jgi:hypothetical protein